MWACATSTVSCQGDDVARTVVGAFGNEGLGEVAIADDEVAVTEWTDKCLEAVGLFRLVLYLDKGKRVSPLRNRILLLL